MVQLLDILFSSKTSVVARMQALSNSIIIFDEIQSIPKKCIYMFDMAMNFLNQYCNTTIVMSSATQPSFDNIAFPIKYAENPDIVQLNDEQKAVFKRSNIINLVNKYGYSYEEACECFEKIAQENQSLLIICNTKNEAFDFYKYFESKKEYCVYHLSTFMFKQNRKRTLDEIFGLLTAIQKGETNKKVVCISTQLVEAGIDFSFASVVRIMAGMDNLSQAAGRCNRSNEYDQMGKVYLINLKSENDLKIMDIRNAQVSSFSVLNRNDIKVDELIEDRGIALFYERLFANYEGVDGQSSKSLGYSLEKESNKTYTELLCGKNSVCSGFGLNYPFKTLGNLFSVFDNNTINVVVECTENKGLIGKLKSICNSSDAQETVRYVNSIMKNLQEYSVNLFEYQLKKLQDNGMIYQLLDGRIFILDERSYNEKYGVDLEYMLTDDDYLL